MSSKDKILALLEANKSTFLSGEAMASSLGISRNAIWKAINDLRKNGYEIEAVSNKGYRLAGQNDILSAAGISSYLKEDVADIYKENDSLIHIYDSIPSTNRKAKELAITDLKYGTLVIANEQSEGRGRADHSFYSPKGGLYMSVVMTPDHLPSTNSDEITTFIGNAVCDAISSLTDTKPTLKPINDLFVGDKKICGILTEAGTEFETGLLQWIVIGIGINFNSDINAFPEDIKNKATSLFSDNDITITRNQLVAEILNRILK